MSMLFFADSVNKIANKRFSTLDFDISDFFGLTMFSTLECHPVVSVWTN
jgi:hypothetical protein